MIRAYRRHVIYAICTRALVQKAILLLALALDSFFGFLLFAFHLEGFPVR